jgi:hypothetical protein
MTRNNAQFFIVELLSGRVSMFQPLNARDWAYAVGLPSSSKRRRRAVARKCHGKRAGTIRADPTMEEVMEAVPNDNRSK